jgi:hypothetical protein
MHGSNALAPLEVDALSAEHGITRLLHSVASPQKAFQRSGRVLHQRVRKRDVAACSRTV